MSYLDQLGFQLPLLVIVGGGCFMLLLEAFARTTSRQWMMYVSVGISVLALAACWLVWRRVTYFGDQKLFDGMLVVDKFSIFLTVLFIIAGLLTSLLSAEFMRTYAVLYGEFYPLVMFGISGMIIVAMAGDLVSIFIGIEIMSLAAYVLTGSFRRAKPSAEAAMKYFVTGAFATGFLLYGIALVYGATGETNLFAIRQLAVSGTTMEPLLVVGMFMLILALGFKVGAVPFHMWAPDAYEGAPTPVTGFMATGVKAAGFAAIMRVFLTAFGGDVLPLGRFGWANVFEALAVLTMVIGNLAALRQENIKRMLAYSSIAHAGYLLIGILAAGLNGTLDVARPAILFYLFAYTFTTLGAFGVVAWVGYKRELVDDWAGMGVQHPLAAFAMTIFMLSLGGMPPTGGFFGKFYVFRAAMDGGNLTWLVVVGVINSVLSIYYYLRVVMTMYFREPMRELQPLKSPAMSAALAICVLFVLFLGLMPSTWLDIANSATFFAR